MKKYFLLYKILLLSLHGIAQLNISPGTLWVVSGNTTVVLQDMNLVNDGSVNAGTGSFKFTGTQNSSISGTSLPQFYTLEIGKTNNAAVLLNRNININRAISFASGLLDLNNNNILLASTAYLAGETEINRITGINGGFVEITQAMNSPNSTNAGNLGAFITSSANLGSVTIRRGHTSQPISPLIGSIQRYYSIVPTNNSNLNATLRLKYFDAELNNQNENILAIYQSTDGGSNWINLSKTSNGTTANYVEKTGVASLALQTLANDNSQVGPVTGLTFTGSRKKSTEVQLNWISQTETNMSGYQVQRKLDNELDFTDRAFVASLAPGGNSSTTLNYQNIDANSYAGNSFYRLKIIDNANNISYSNIISVAGKTKGAGGKGGGNNITLSTTTEEIVTGKVMNAISEPLNGKITVGPNPNNGNFWFTVNGLDKESEATLITIDGKLINKFMISNWLRQSVNNLSSGIYILKVPGFDVQRIIVQGNNTRVINPTSGFDKN